MLKSIQKLAPAPPTDLYSPVAPLKGVGGEFEGKTI